MILPKLCRYIVTNVPVHAEATLPPVRDLVSVSTFLSKLYVLSIIMIIKYQISISILPRYVHLLYPMSAVSFCASIYMTLAVTVERYIAVCRPHQFR